MVEWQRRRTQNPLLATTCGFKSHFRHHRHTERRKALFRVFFCPKACLYSLKAGFLLAHRPLLTVLGSFYPASMLHFLYIKIPTYRPFVFLSFSFLSCRLFSLFSFLSCCTPFLNCRKIKFFNQVFQISTCRRNSNPLLSPQLSRKQRSPQSWYSVPTTRLYPCCFP